MKSKIQSMFKQKRGATMADLSIAVVIIAVFTGVVGTLLYKSYAVSSSIVNSANTSAYATLIMEKVDEKPFEEITSNFVKNLTTAEEGQVPEVEVIDGAYSFEFQVREINKDEYMVQGSSIFKQVTLTVFYHKGKQDEEKITLSKIKVKEMGNI